LVDDPERGVVVLFGGRTRGTVFDETWEWDGERWTEFEVSGPPARSHGVAAFDRSSNQVIVYGGVGTDDAELRDTWGWDGRAWTRLDEVGIPDRAPNGMAWDGASDRLLVLAVDLRNGTADGAYPSDLWAWAASGWQAIEGAGPAFSPLQSFVEGRSHPFLLDGGAINDRVTLWRWTGSDWLTLTTGGPAPRNGQAAAFDLDRERLVVFGGSNGTREFGDTWEFDGSAWRLAAPPRVAP
jgi:hypothetical protein